MNNISIVGIGKLGLCFALSLEKAGYNVCGVDISSEYISSINTKQYKTSEPLVEEYLLTSHNLFATTELKIAVDMADTIFAVVATPSLPDGKYDHSQLQSVCNKLKALGVQETCKHLVVCCTVMPGFTDVLQKEFKSIFMMAKCNHHILHVSTMSFWGAYLDKKQSGKTFYHENFEKCHTDRMIPKSLNWIKL